MRVVPSRIAGVALRLKGSSSSSHSRTTTSTALRGAPWQFSKRITRFDRRCLRAKYDPASNCLTDPQRQLQTSNTRALGTPNRTDAL